MTSQIVTILGVLGGTAVLVPIGFGVWSAWRQKRIPRLTTQELKALFWRPSNFTLFHQATLELRARNEDISFTLPIYVDLALSDTFIKQAIGKGCLKAHFPELLSGRVDLDENPLSEETKEKLRGLKG